MLYANRGNTYRMEGRLRARAARFDDGIRINSREAGLIYGRSQVYADKGDTARALSPISTSDKAAP